MTIRPFRPDDASAWRRLRHALWSDTTEEHHAHDLAAALANPDTDLILIADIDGHAVGFVEVRLRSHADGCSTSPVGYLEGWYVDPEHRRKGLGGALVRAAEAWARARGCHEMASDTHVDNDVSVAAHRALGFQAGEAIVPFFKSL